MNITELSTNDNAIRIHVKGRGIDGIAKVGIRAHTVKADSYWDGDKRVEQPAFTTARLTLSFAPDELTVNGKRYDNYEHAAFEPARLACWHEDVRDMLTDTGMQRIGYRATMSYTHLTDSARDKVKQAVILAADKYLTIEAAKDALVADALDDVDSATKKRVEAEREETAARERLAAMRAL